MNWEVGQFSVAVMGMIMAFILCMTNHALGAICMVLVSAMWVSAMNKNDDNDTPEPNKNDKV